MVDENSGIQVLFDRVSVFMWIASLSLLTTTGATAQLADTGELTLGMSHRDIT